MSGELPVRSNPVNAGRIERMRTLLAGHLQPTRLEVRDDSHHHIGHEGAKDGRGHFSVHVVSDAFTGVAALARHRLVYAALGEMMQTDIHALSIRAQTPQEADEER